MREHPEERSNFAARRQRLEDSLELRSCGVVGNGFDGH